MRLTAVSYLNTKPFIYGLFRSDLAEMIDLSLDPPAVCAQKLLAGEADVALTPVAIIPQLPEAHLVSDYCIGSTRAVKTVCVFSQVPLPEVRQIYLDFHSRSSVALVRLLCERYWKIDPKFLPAAEGYENDIAGNTAGLIIGDRAIGCERRFAFTYDLGEAWTAWTGLPFVYAAWVSTRPLHPEIAARFNAALRMGLDHLPELIKIIPNIPHFDTEKYFRENISYELDEPKWRGLNQFLTYLAGENGYRLLR